MSDDTIILTDAFFYDAPVTRRSWVGTYFPPDERFVRYGWWPRWTRDAFGLLCRCGC